MSTTAMTFRLEKDTKEQADVMFASIGLSTGTAITMFLKRFVDTGVLPFTPEVTDPFYAPANITHLKQTLAHGQKAEHNLIEAD